MKTVCSKVGHISNLKKTFQTNAHKTAEKMFYIKCVLKVKFVSILVKILCFAKKTKSLYPKVFAFYCTVRDLSYDKLEYETRRGPRLETFILILQYL